MPPHDNVILLQENNPVKPKEVDNSNSQYEILVFILTRNNFKKRTKRWLHQQSKSNLSDAGRHLPCYSLNRRAKLAANALTTIAIILVFLIRIMAIVVQIKQIY
jgi:hypothetical protein